jgi:sigma-B regulation protein RsbU (phosphoserine phosphatase)
MGIALERARLVDMLQEQRVHEQAVLLELSNQMLARPDMADLSQYLVEEVRTLLNADACAMLVPCDDPRYLDFCAASGWRDDPVRAGRQVPANERSSAGWAMHNQQPLIQRDHASAGAAQWSPDWMRAEGFKGHAVMPLIAGGHAVGALVIDMREPRLLDEDETRFLRLLANQAAIVVENARLYNKTLRQQHLERELALGQEIQLSMLPQVAPNIEGWEFAVIYEAARVVAGDFYDFFVLPREEGRVGLVVADVADKGVPAALFMALSRTVIRTMALSGRSPASALMRANSVILNDVQSDLFLSAFYAKVDTRAGRMAYANAGHNPPLWFRAAGGAAERLDADGIVLGVLDDIELEEERIDVAPGDVLVFYTDGVTEAMNAADEEFGMGRFQAAVEAVAADPGAGANDIVEAVRHAVNTFTGSRPQTDDFTLFVVKRLNREETI